MRLRYLLHKLNFLQTSFPGVIKGFSCVLVVCISFCAVTTVITKQPSKIAIILHDNQSVDRQERVAHAEEILRFHNYQTHIITDVADFKHFKADRIIVLYIGHGRNSTTPFLLFQKTEYEVTGFLQYIKAKELVLISASCFSGSWMNLAQKGRLIISVANMTFTISILAQFSPYAIGGSIVNLLKTVHVLEVPLEVAYEIWVDEIMFPWYQCISRLNWDYRDATTWHPLIYDGIIGNLTF